MTTKHALELGAGLLAGVALVDPTRIVIAGVLLRLGRERHPEMFDGQLALANIEAALASCAHERQSGQLRRAANGYAGFVICDDCGADVVEHGHAPASEPPRLGLVSPSRST